MSPPVALHRIATNGIRANVAVAGTGPAVVLLHGFPHTWQLWSRIIGPLSAHHRVIAPDLRGFGASTRAPDGYDAGTPTSPTSTASSTNLPNPPQPWSPSTPELPSRLGSLPGAEDFLAAGPPWWFGFHAVPGLAETVLIGHEAAYVDWFLGTGTLGRGVPPGIQDAFIDAYTGPDALRCAFSYYRALPTSARQLTDAAAQSRLTVPTLAIGAHPVGVALERQPRPIADDLTGHLIPDCGHIIPLDRPRELLALLLPFLAADAHRQRISRESVPVDTAPARHAWPRSSGDGTKE